LSAIACTKELDVTHTSVVPYQFVVPCMVKQENQLVGGLLPGGIRVRGLSGGEKRRLSLCCASITKPDILFADEPTSGIL